MAMTSVGAARASNDEAVSTGPAADESSLREALATMQERERRLVQLLHCTGPEKMEHDLRNVLNELMLLRRLLELQSSE